MTDTWRKYFTPAPDLDTSKDLVEITAEHLIHHLPTREDSKQMIERILANRHSGGDLREAMRMLRHRLPEMIYVVAASVAIARDFCIAISRRPNNCRLVTEHYQLQGLDNVTIVFVGNYHENPKYRQMMGVLTGRRNIDRWDIHEWVYL